jgi:hypothetical protein
MRRLRAVHRSYRALRARQVGEKGDARRQGRCDTRNLEKNSATQNSPGIQSIVGSVIRHQAPHLDPPNGSHDVTAATT